MVCGVNLGLLVLCLVQVAYVRCSWATQDKGFKKQNANAYDPFTQNRLRQASFPSGFDQSLIQGLSGNGYSEDASEMTQNGWFKVKYVTRRPNPQEPKGNVLQKWPLQGSEITSVSKSSSPEKTDHAAVRNRPVQSSRGHGWHMSSGSGLQSARENYAPRKPPMTPVDLKDQAQTSATVRGKPVHGSKKHTYNQKERFPVIPVQVDQYPSGPQLSNPQSYNGYSWSQPQSNLNQETPNNQDTSSQTVTYHVANKYGGSLIIRLKNKDRSEEVRLLETETWPRQMVFDRTQGPKVPKSIWKKIMSNMTLLD